MPPLPDDYPPAEEVDEVPDPVAPAEWDEKRATKKAKELELWRTWNENGRQPEHLEPLLDSFEPVFTQHIKDWKAPSIPKSAFHAELTRLAIGAFETYDPNHARGAALATHVIGRLKPAHRYRERTQNLAYIPSEKLKGIGQVDRAVDALTTDLGREPSVEELADHVGMPVKKLLGVQRSRRRDIASSAFESDPLEVSTPRDREILEALPEELTPDETAVFNHIYGLNGHPRLDETNEIARRLGRSAPQVSRLRASIGAKYRRSR